jgi:hypothetical protein
MIILVLFTTEFKNFWLNTSRSFLGKHLQRFKKVDSDIINLQFAMQENNE